MVHAGGPCDRRPSPSPSGPSMGRFYPCAPLGPRARTRLDHDFGEHVEVGRVGHVLVGEGHNDALLALPERVLEVVLAGRDPVEVALERVDLAVVAEEAEGLRERPARVRVGREARVVDGEVGHVGVVRQVLVELPDRARVDHALVHDRPPGERAEVEVARVLRGEALAAELLDRLAENVQPTLERAELKLLRRLDDELLEHRHGSLGDAAHELHVGRDLAEALDREARCLGRLLNDGHARLLRLGRGREEHLSHASVGAGEARDSLLDERPRDLRHQADAVTGETVRGARAAVLHAADGAESLRNDAVAALAVEVGDEANLRGGARKGRGGK